MEQQIEEKNTEMGNIITRSEEFIKKNQKTIITIGIALVVVAVAIFAYFKFYKQPREAKAANEMFAAEQWFAQGDYETALKGDDTFRGFLGIIDTYGSTKVGNLAKYYAGVANLRLGNYEEAAKWLGKYSGKDIFTRPLAEMMQGDAAMEQGQTQKAADLYMKAANMDDNYITAPTALFKAGMSYIMLGSNDKAAECFNKVKKNYPESTEAQDIDKYIALVENK